METGHDTHAEEAVIVMRGPLADLQRAAGLLESHGIEAAIGKTEDDGCGSGSCGPSCGPKLWLAVAGSDVPAAMVALDGDWRAGLDQHQIEALERAAQIVIDPDAAETTCPACLTTFRTGPRDCPDCGLRLG